MPTASDFESRRRERRRRERLRKKRIRAVIILIALIGIIAVICLAISTCSKPGENTPPSDNTITETSAPETISPTVAPVFENSLNIPSPTEENNLLQIIADSGQKKRCYLTFDDGPTQNITPQILDTLRRYNAKATFFEVGSLIDSNPDIARRVYEEGHLIANHSYGHNYEKLYASTDAFITEIEQCETSIKNVMNGEEPFKLMRFPGGSYNAGDHAAIKQDCKEALKEHGFYYIDWNSLNGDAEGKSKNAEELLEYLKQTSAGYNNLIVLMHDASSKQATADALGPIIEYLSSQGYTFHRLDDIDYQNASLSSSVPQSSTSPSSSSSAETESPTNSSTPSTAPTTNTEGSLANESDSSSNASSTSTTAPTSTQSATQKPSNSSTGAIIIQ